MNRFYKEHALHEFGKACLSRITTIVMSYISSFSSSKAVHKCASFFRQLCSLIACRTGDGTIVGAVFSFCLKLECSVAASMCVELQFGTVDVEWQSQAHSCTSCLANAVFVTSVEVATAESPVAVRFAVRSASSAGK